MRGNLALLETVVDEAGRGGAAVHEHGGGRVGTAGQPGRWRSKGSVLQQLVLSGVKTPLAGGSPRPHPSCFVQETRLVHGETMGWLSNGMRAQGREGGVMTLVVCTLRLSPRVREHGQWFQETPCGR